MSSCTRRMVLVAAVLLACLSAAPSAQNDADLILHGGTVPTRCSAMRSAMMLSSLPVGQWAVWTRCAVDLVNGIKAARATDGAGVSGILAHAAALTDANAALFDAKNGFSGCIAGLHEILRRQGLLAGRWWLDPHEDLSPGQMEEIDRVCRAVSAFAGRRIRRRELANVAEVS